MDTESIKAISDFLFVRNQPETADLAFVMGSPSVNSLYPALNLFHTGMVKKILITGGGIATNGQPEWELYRDHALAAGVPNECLLIEKFAKNTQQNIMFGFDTVSQAIGWQNIKAVALCAKPFHMRRALMTAKCFFPKDIRIIASPPEDSMNLSPSNWAETPLGRQRVLEELGKISRYALQGDFDAE